MAWYRQLLFFIYIYTVHSHSHHQCKGKELLWDKLLNIFIRLAENNFLSTASALQQYFFSIMCSNEGGPAVDLILETLLLLYTINKFLPIYHLKSLLHHVLQWNPILVVQLSCSISLCKSMLPYNNYNLSEKNPSRTDYRPK